MIPLHAIFSPKFAAIMGLASCLALAGVLSYEEPMSRQEKIDPSPSLHALTPPSAPIQNGTLPIAANSPADVTPSLNWIGHGNPLWATSLSSFSATLGRPIFSPSRRPPAAPELASAPAPPPTVSQPRRPLLALVGAIAGQSEGIAIFLDETTKGIVRLKTGESHSGWTLRLVASREATLQRGGEIAILALSNLPAK
jgi:general secretion pathway protein N